MRISDWSSDVCSSDLLGLALAVIATHTFVLLATGAGSNVASLAPGTGISGLLDRQFLPGLILRGSWDPEGVLSTLPSMASGFFGIALARWAGAPRHIRRLAFAGAILVLAGLLAATIVPINKNLRSEERRVGKESVSTCRS